MLVAAAALPVPALRRQTLALFAHSMRFGLPLLLMNCLLDEIR
jgi:hypothetical protein